MSDKQIHQLTDKNGKPVAAGRTAHGWFLNDSQDLQVDEGAPVVWGELFAQSEPGNDVEFYVTGTEYFQKVASAIDGAHSSLFIAGWQINYDVELVGKKTLFEYLHKAVERGVTVYVMPWMSPKVGMDTGDLDTLLALVQLNAGKPKGKLHCMPAMQQSDQGTLGIAFSHHQKLVVADNKYAFVGGMDLAYGRRCDAALKLKATGTLNELYNPCVPAIHELTFADQKDCVTRMELLAAAIFNNDSFFSVGGQAKFWTSPADRMASVWDAKHVISETAADARQSTKDWLNENLDIALFDDIQDWMQKKGADAAKNGMGWAWEQINPHLRAKLEYLRKTGSANAQNIAAAAIAWLNNASLDQLPPQMIVPVSNTLQALSCSLTMLLTASATANQKPYQRLLDKVKVTPKSGQTIDSAVQPRMPWHDIHSRVEGPAVYDLSMNFVRRWNATAQSLESPHTAAYDEVAQFILSGFGLKMPKTPKLERIAARDLPKRAAKTAAKCNVQVLRSAPKNLRQQEAAGMKEQARPALVQNNCLKAMVRAIRSSVQFIYIEGQFFQSAYGSDGARAGDKSGPLSVSLELRQNPSYEKYIDMLGIRNVPLKDIAKKMHYEKVDNVMAEVRGREFMADLKIIQTNLATIRLFSLLAKPQDHIKNPIGQALANRIAQAIRDGKPYHVYMVLPVHPEGLLNGLNIMDQVYLTMQSLVFGENSLVNNIRRNILAARWAKQDKKITFAAAMVKVKKDVLQEDLEKQVENDWQQYLTLLNLRNWETFDKQTVTEQIYVHSKLLIADDAVAILGSANINDRSTLGDRDSEIAVIVTDDNKKLVKLDGTYNDWVSTRVHELRRSLWQKLFGQHNPERRAAGLLTNAILNSPVNPATWQAIQQQAADNAKAYETAFWYIPRSGAHQGIQQKDPNDRKDKSKHLPPASIWPTWRYKKYTEHDKGGQLRYRMPFDPFFWQKPGPRDVINTWNVGKDVKNALAPVEPPNDIQGFITALPIRWTWREHNRSGLNLTMLANNTLLPPDVRATLAQAGAELTNPVGKPEDAPA